METKIVENVMDQEVFESIVQQKGFYENAAKYWDGIPPTVDGMLGGFGYISKTDISGSKLFLKSLFKSQEGLGRERALDCGAGIGRITGNLLANYFDVVDLVEQNPKFLEQAKTYLKKSSNKIGKFFSVGLQDFCPEPNTYDVIWCQWVLGHLNNDDLNKFFHNCKKGLKKNGVLVIKENVTSSNLVEIDEGDSSMTRPYIGLVEAFKKSGFLCISEEKQQSMPQGLYPVYMFALRPCDSGS
ncbi:N-terminal Xaa-Pro-Lys N-methyltransferase 1 [Copidosoma floridanum]|uniref:N-terminal Xaa-Pro-Lys N-methyltransferase 1 n=1 Tax=Copidosoma floridanum TaxID=29053 RepID=UPI0006C9BDAE|nr:N-terminal Xaa-Pro-Lys N-methyltransferase 1 [Copidosoma floridanum]